METQFKNKLAQKIIVNLYLRYRMNRKHFNAHVEYYKDNNEIFIKNEHNEKWKRWELEALKWDSWNALQASKQIYYENL